MDVELQFGSRVCSHIEDAGVHPDCVLGTDLHAVSAVDADPKVDVEPDRILLDVGVRVLSSHNGDALRRTDCLAEHAPYTTGRSLVPDGEPVPAPESRRE